MYKATDQQQQVNLKIFHNLRNKIIKIKKRKAILRN